MTRVMSVLAAGPPVVVVLRAASSRHVLEVADLLVDHGFSCLEVALTTPDGPRLVGELRQRHPGACIGAGTVLQPRDVEAVAEAGAEFVVSPNVDRDVGLVAHENGLAWLPGAATPTEVVTADRAGADFVKLFPAFLLQPAFVSALLQVLPDVRLVPTGGVDAVSAPQYVAAGAAAVGVGDWLVGAALRAGDARLASRPAERLQQALGTAVATR